MIKKLFEYIIPIAFVAVVQLGFGLYLNLKDSRIISFSDPVQVDANQYSQSVIIDNDSKEELDGIIFVASNCVIKEVRSTDRSIDTKIQNNEITVSKIYPMRNISLVLLLESSSTNEKPSLELVNATNNNINLITTRDYRGKLKVNWISIGFAALSQILIISLMILFSNFYFDRQRKIRKEESDLWEKENKVYDEKISFLEDRLEIATAKQKEFQEKVDVAEKDVQTLRNQSLKYQLLHRKIFLSIEKENEFYRRLLMTIHKEKFNAVEMNELWNFVRRTLKTFPERVNDQIDINMIDVIENILKGKS